MRTLPWLALVCAGCAEDSIVASQDHALVDVTDVVQNVPNDTEGDPLDTGIGFDDEAPDAHIDRVRGTVEPPVELTGEAWDPQYGAEVQLELSSDLDGPLLVGLPQDDGTWRWSGWLEEGAHMIRLVVRDPAGNVAAVERVVSVDHPNNPPECGITLPVSGEVYSEDESVEMEGWASDADGEDVVLYWSSDLQGALFAGESWSARLDPGEHLLTLQGDDGEGGTCTDSVTVTVESRRLHGGGGR